MPNTNFQTILQMPGIVNDIVKQATGRESVSQIDMDFVTVAQDKQTVPNEIDFTALASFVNNNQLPLTVLAKITAVQSGTGDPAPDNVRPITGWTGAKVTRCGKNLLENNFIESTDAGITGKTNQDGSITVTGTGTGTVNPFFYLVGSSGSYPNVLKAGQYVLSQGIVTDNNTFLRIVFDPSESSTPTISLQGVAEKTFVITKDLHYLVYMRVNGSVDYSENPITIYPMLRLASSTDSTYEPYNGDTYTITFPEDPGTVYGGVLNVTTGVLTVTAKYRSVTDSSVIVRSTDHAFYLIGADGIAGQGNITTGVISDRFPTRTLNNQDAVFLNNNGAVHINTANAYASASDMLTGVGGSFEVVYPLATPITYQLTPTEIDSLIGENNLYADTEDIFVSYTSYIPVP